jgi:hypothetical protein
LLIMERATVVFPDPVPPAIPIINMVVVPPKVASKRLSFPD